jgi:CrcB protein
LKNPQFPAIFFELRFPATILSMTIFLFSALALCGAWLRVGIEKLLPMTGTEFPRAIFLCNVVGSFAIGAIHSWSDRIQISPEWRWSLTAGFLGSFTTFSTFSMQNVSLIQSGRTGLAAIYSLTSLSIAFLGVFLGQQLFKAS